MLSWLEISDFALIGRAELEFESGMNILTGETGSGKSILVDALGALLGEKLSAESIRAGADRARIEAIFRIDRHEYLRTDLEASGLTLDGNELTISREIGRSGRSTARVNGVLTPLAALQGIGNTLVDIHGQSRHLSLLRVPEHVHLLDQYGGLTEMRLHFGHLAEHFRDLENEIAETVRRGNDAKQRIELLRYQLDEIGRANLAEGEDDALLAEREVIANAVALAAGADTAYNLLAGGDERSAIELLGRAIKHLTALKRFDPQLSGRIDQLESSLYQVEDATSGLLDYRDNLEFTPERLAQIEERLDLIQELKRKYGDSIKAILEYTATFQEQLDLLENRQNRSYQLGDERNRLFDKLSLLASDLSEKRKETAHRLDSQITRELKELALSDASFTVQVQQIEGPQGVRHLDGRQLQMDFTGVDRVEFLVSLNPGTPLRGISRVASGGETARLMLALKSVLGRGAGLPVQIFDEIDAGIGGRVGRIVGQKLWNLAQERQLICVTHLPQVASFATNHFLVSKSADGPRAAATVAVLDRAHKVKELAAMLSGVSGSSVSERNAQEMLERADRWKQSQVWSLSGREQPRE